MNFAERLTHLQKERKLNKKEIFEAVGLSRTAYYRYETGGREPSISILTALADFFNVSTDYLIGRTDNPKMN
jgi:transcriptional regulator with XRE-family HTH domain